MLFRLMGSHYTVMEVYSYKSQYCCQCIYKNYLINVRNVNTLKYLLFYVTVRLNALTFSFLHLHEIHYIFCLLFFH